MADAANYDLNGILAQLFRVGPTDDERKAAASQALTRAGLGILAGNQPSRMPINPAGVLAQGIGSGLDTYQAQTDKAQAERKANAALAMQGLSMQKQMRQMDALQGLVKDSAPSPFPQQALAAGAASGDVGPTVGNAARLASLQGNPVSQGYTPLAPDRLARAAAAGVDINPFLKLNAEARPDIHQIDAGNEIILQDRKTMRELGRIKKNAAPGAMPFEAGDLPAGDYRQFLLNKANAGAAKQITNVNSFLPASEEAQRDFIKKASGRYDQLQSAPTLLQNIEEAKALVPQAKGFMGPGGQNLLDAAKFLNNRLGMQVNTEGVKSAEELRTRMFIQVMDNLKKMDAQPSTYQQRVMEDAFGNLGTDPNALPKVLDVFGDIVRGKVGQHNAEITSAISRNVKFPFDPLIKLPEKPAAPSPSPSPRDAAPQKGQVVDGWEFLGGDPSNRMSWRKR